MNNLGGTKLVTFGDSWVKGTELNPYEKSFVVILADMLGTEFENYGIEVLNPEGRRTPKSWRGKSPVELGFIRIYNAKD